MIIKVGTSIADDRVVDKTKFITFRKDILCEVFHECNVMNPVFLLEYDSSIVGDNYVKAWDRYYYINNITLAPGGRMYLECTEDVLMSNKDDILKLTAYCVKSETHQARYIIDSDVPTEVKSYVHTIPFSETLFNADGTERQYVLTVKGGGQYGSN